MPIAVNWLEGSPNILEMVVSDPWKFADITRALDTADIMTRDRTDTMGILFDLSPSAKTPRLDLPEFRRMSQHPLVLTNRMQRVHVGGTRVLSKTLIEMVTPFFPFFFSIVKLYPATEDALAALKQFLAGQTTS